MRLAAQPLLGLCTLAAAFFALAATCMVQISSVGAAEIHRAEGMTVLLVSLAILSHRYPIHIRHNTKVDTATVPLYLMAVLLPAPVAAVLVGATVLASDLLTRAERGSYFGDIASETGRWTVIALLGSFAAHFASPIAGLPELSLITAAVVMWAGDMVTCPLTLSPLTGEPPLRLILLMVRQAGLAEGAQYVVALLGAVVAMQHPWALILLALPTILVYFSFKSSKEVRDSTRQILESMADAVDLRDPYTGGHSRRVAEYSARILQELPMYGPEADLIVSCARVHDIGKIGIPDDILRKDGPLTADERAFMEMHPDSGANLLARYPDFARGVEIIRHHHEAWDGTGYPQRLKDTEIPLGARVIAVADSFDAMTSDRPYRRGMPFEKALRILREGRVQQWDAAIVDAFTRSMASEEQPTVIIPHTAAAYQTAASA